MSDNKITKKVLETFQELKDTEPTSSDMSSSDEIDFQQNKRVKLMEQVYNDITSKQYCNNSNYDNNLNFKSKDDQTVWNLLPLTHSQKEQLLKFVYENPE